MSLSYSRQSNISRCCLRLILYLLRSSTSTELTHCLSHHSACYLHSERIEYLLPDVYGKNNISNPQDKTDEIENTQPQFVIKFLENFDEASE